MDSKEKRGVLHNEVWAAHVPTRDLIVMHLFEAARLASQVEGQFDQRLFGYIIGMAIEAAQEGEKSSSRDIRFHS